MATNRSYSSLTRHIGRAQAWVLPFARRTVEFFPDSSVNARG